MNHIYTLFAIPALLGACVTNNSAKSYRELEVVRHVDVGSQSETIVAESKGYQYKASVRLRSFTRSDIQDHSHWFGVDGGLPKYVVDMITLERDGRMIAIPRRVYADFGDISFEPQQRRVRLSTTRGQMIMEYGGSDGAGSYDATLYFTDQAFDRAIISGGTRNIERR